ncbi:alpha/beta fold hydrolase [Tenuibacillus multivorans]|uniref:Pimeloyl-ACP methyl ester carboxylesterase n=1 Tax=Tenuibacillus multivorans TaxID=237069 RepID=A0A1H0BMY1_9BACI|nr:alpha/beta fold hydrolase [Tenuibacillus multivorans]GEL77104.1 hypothetical protein TMU01_13390 [Tenuibacillus multivorans]SDN46932.1 Pimeloyl-ACP methyl ester carboxylesterase [Tenuibacillus multivorans]
MAYSKKGNDKIYYNWIDAKNSSKNETLILIHGVGHDLHSWDFIIPYLEKNFNILMYDLRGHGNSDRGNYEVDIKLLSEDLNFIIEACHIQSFHIIAQGFGGFVGLKLATQHNKKLKSMTLMGVPIHYPKKIGQTVVHNRNKMVQSQSFLSMAEQLIKQICYPLTGKKELILLNSYSKVSPDVYFQLFSTHYLEAGADALKKLKIPILLLSGAEDPIYPPELSSASLNFNSNARYYTVPDASFMIQMDQPQLTAQWMTEFIIKQTIHTKDDATAFNDLYRKQLTSELYSGIREMIENDKMPSNMEVNQSTVESFTDRERHILFLLKQGLTNKEIGQRLFLSEGTIKFYTHNIFSKLQVRNRTQALIKVRELDILPNI